jgi:hypothetical protein
MKPACDHQGDRTWMFILLIKRRGLGETSSSSF